MSVLAMIFACTPEEQPDNNGDNNGTENEGGNNGGENQTPTDETYATITATLTGSPVKTAWAEGDEIKVIGVKDNVDQESVYVLTAGAGTATGTFGPKEGSPALAKGGAYFGAYPNSDALTFAMHNTFSLTLAAEQTGDAPIFAYADDAATMNFASVLGAVKVAFKGEGNIGAVKVTDKKANNVLSGNTTYNPKTAKLSIQNGAATKNSVTKKLAAATALSLETATEFVVEVPAGTLAEGAEVELLDMNGAPVVVQEIPAVTVELGKVADGGVYAVEVIAATFDLSTTEGGAANTYIIPDTGKYKFPAVKGNDTSAKLATAATAHILYETYCNGEAVVANSLVAELALEEGYVVFTTPKEYKEGNAVVCVKDEAGAILWSWHLWFTNDVIPTIAYGAQELMDRNLGALGNTPEDGSLAYGLMYQWGRPSPFVGVVDATAEELVAMTTAPAYDEVFVHSFGDKETHTTVETAIANPTTGYFGAYCWYEPFTEQLWATQKTVYDPCPPGYVIPADDSALYKGLGEPEAVTGKGWKYNGAWYPITGFWKYSGDWYRNDMTYIYTAEMQENPEQGGYINVWIVKYNAESFSHSYDRKAALCNVRCAKVSAN